MKLAKSKNLKVEVRREISRRQREERDKLVGAPSRRRRSPERKSLEGLVVRPTPVRVRYERKTYVGTLRPDGKIVLRRRVYHSPNAASKSVGRRGRGWGGWELKRGRRWVPLRALKEN